MGNILSLRSAVVRVQNWYWGVHPFAEQCVVCLEQKRVFKKMHRTLGTEQPHLVCLDCHRAWERKCAENRADRAPEERLICPICVRARCYMLSMSVYVACWACQQLRKTENNSWPMGEVTWPSVILAVPSDGIAFAKPPNVRCATARDH